MIRINKWTQKPAGQVLISTLFFCFVFFALFIGLYKSGILYNSKERAARATDLTALSAGAVYANGLQLVRVTNAILLAFAVLDAVIIAAAIDFSGGLAATNIGAIDPHTRKFVQVIQDALFGVSTPLGMGAYPFLIFSESISLASDNQLKNTWPSANPLAWKIPIPPSPVLLFNLEGSEPEISFVPNMALKFRTANLFLPDLNKPAKPKKRYHLTEKKSGIRHTFTSDEIEVAPNSKNAGQMRVKSGDFKNRYVSVINEAETEAEKEAEKRLKKESLSKMKSALGMSNLLSGIQMDVTDRDDPPDHTVIVNSSFPAPVGKANNYTTDIQSISEVSVEGDGLAAWDLNDPPYQTQLVSKDPSELAKLVNIQKNVSDWAASGKLPSTNDIFNMVPHGNSGQ